MCGIAGYIGKNCCENILIDFLGVLEYRGYDSSGIAIKIDNKIKVIKDIVRIGELKKSVQSKTYNTLGIGHTRWATHGGVEQKNSHPHLSSNGEWCIVHNGIIENYLQLKSDLIKKGCVFNSDTDSEVIAQILEQNNVDDLNGFAKCIDLLEGSYAICAINNKSNAMFLARNKSPLYVGIADDGKYISSDIVCFEGYCQKYIDLDNNEICYISDNSIVVRDKNINIVDKKYFNLPKIINSRIIGKYNTYMEKEINEIPEVCDRVIQQYMSHDYFKNIKK